MKLLISLEKQKWTFLIVGLGFIALVAFGLSDYFHHPQMSEANVIRAANAIAASTGVALSGFETPQVRFEFPERERTWTVIYKRNYDGLQVCVWVEVDDQTGQGRATIVRAPHPMAVLKL